MAYEEVNPTNWEYKKEGESIEGFFVRSQKDVGVNKSFLYSLETSQGIKNVWGSVILDEKMALVKLGDKIRITYKGLSKETSKGKKPAKLFKVEIDKQEETKE